VKVFNATVKENGKTFEEYMINGINYTLKNTTTNWCHNYMSKFPNCSFLKLMQTFCKRRHKMQNHKQIYTKLKNIKHGNIERVKVYYDGIHKLVHGLQTPTINIFLANVFHAKLQSYLRITTIVMKRITLQLHK
jgi:hypothetical protein